MAPEVLERPYDERSDVWSLGCIVLDAATCGFFDVRGTKRSEEREGALEIWSTRRGQREKRERRRRRREEGGGESKYKGKRKGEK